MNSATSRRRFLASSVAAGSLLLTTPRAPASVRSANDRVRIAVLGLNGRLSCLSSQYLFKVEGEDLGLIEFEPEHDGLPGGDPAAAPGDRRVELIADDRLIVCHGASRQRLPLQVAGLDTDRTSANFSRLIGRTATPSG